MYKFQAVLVSKDYYRSSLQYQLRVPGKKLGFITLVSLILLGAPCSKLLASQAQLSATTPPGLESAENSIVEAEEFNDSYAKAVASLNDAAIQKLDLQRSALQKKLIAANADLGRYLKAHPKDVNGLLMLVRFDQAKQWAFWQEIQRHKEPGAGRDPGKIVDLVLEIDPANAEGCYRKALLLLSGRLSSGPDLSKGMEYALLAVQHAPQSIAYSELLATILYSQGKLAEAAEAVRPLQQGTHPIYRLLQDLTQARVPEGSVFDTSAISLIAMLAPQDHSQFRVVGYLYPGPASEVEEFYRQNWPDFKPQTNPGGGYDVDDTGTTRPANGFVAIFRWKDGRLTSSPETFPADFTQHPAGELAEKSPLRDALTLWVSESPKLTKDNRGGTTWEGLPADFSGERACEIHWINFRAFVRQDFSPPQN